MFIVKAAQLKTEKDDEQSEPPTQSDNVKVTDPQTQGIGQADQSDNQVNTQFADQDDGNQASADKSHDAGYDYTQQADDTQTMIDNASKFISKANSVKTASTTQPHYDDYTEYSYTDSDQSTDQKPLIKKHHKKHHSKTGYTSPGKNMAWNMVMQAMVVIVMIKVKVTRGQIKVIKMEEIVCNK